MPDDKRLSTYLLLLPGAGFIVLFLVAAIIMTVMQSFGLFALTRESRFTIEYWSGIFDQQVFDLLLFSIKVGLGSAFGTLLFSYPLALFMRKSFFGKRMLSSLVKIPLFVPALVAAFLIINIINDDCPTFISSINICLFICNIIWQNFLSMFIIPNTFKLIF